MSADVTIERKITIVLSGDLGGTQEYAAASADDSAVQAQPYTLTGGVDFVFALPKVNASSKRTRSVTIVKPSDYTGTLILKGQNTTADADGIMLHPTDPDTISLDDTRNSIVLRSSVNVTLLLVWG